MVLAMGLMQDYQWVCEMPVSTDCLEEANILKALLLPVLPPYCL